MRANESDVQNSVRVIRAHDQTILVAGDIEHDSTSPDDAGVAKRRFYIGGTAPIGLRCLAEPGFEWLLCIVVCRTLPKLPKRLPRDDPHWSTELCHDPALGA